MLRYMFLLFFTASCAAPAYTTKHGIAIYNKTTTLTPTQSEVEAVIDHVMEHFDHPFFLRGMDIHFYNSLIYVPLADGKTAVADGYLDLWKGVAWVSVVRRCFADSSLVHELAHVIQAAKLIDPEHSDKEFWGMVEQLEEKVIADLCPEGYVRAEVSSQHEPGQIVGE